MALIGAVPLLVLAVLPTLHDRSIVSEFTNNVIVPAGADFHVHAKRVGDTVVFDWTRPAGARGKVFYRIYRSPIAGQPPIGGLTDYLDGIACLPRSRGAAACRLLMDAAAVTRAPPYAEKLPSGWETYRIGMMANWLDDPLRGDVLMVSRPVRIHGVP